MKLLKEYSSEALHTALYDDKYQQNGNSGTASAITIQGNTNGPKCATLFTEFTEFINASMVSQTQLA